MRQPLFYILHCLDSSIVKSLPIRYNRVNKKTVYPERDDAPLCTLNKRGCHMKVSLWGNLFTERMKFGVYRR